jgi:tetratricopeptide (TPR) repeat protein
MLGMSLSEDGSLDEACAGYKRALEIWPEQPYARAGLVDVYARMSREQDAQAQLQALERLARGSAGQAAASLAWAHSTLGNIDEAFEWIERAVEARDSIVVSLPTFVAWDPLRSDPRFEEILRRLHFPEWSYKRVSRQSEN